MNAITSTRGQVYLMNGYSPGSYKVSGLSRSGIIITGVTIEDNDLIMLKQTINGRKIIYTAGTAFGNVAISGEVFLGSASCRSNVKAGFDVVNDWFNYNRVSNSGIPVNISVDNVGYKVYIVGLALSQADPQFNVQGFTILGTLANPSVK